jgi:hypothetical protein
MILSTELTAAREEPYDKIYPEITMKSLLPNTKFRLRAQGGLSQRRLQAPPNGHSPPLSGSTILKDLQFRSQAAKLLGHLDQLSRARVRLYSSPVSAPPQYRLPEIPRLSLSAINRANQKFGSGSSPDCVGRTMWVPKRLSSSLMTWSPRVRTG